MGDIALKIPATERAYMLSVKDCYSHNIKHFVSYLDEGGKPFEIETVREYIQDQLDQGVPAGTVAVRVAAIKKRIREMFKQSPDFLDAAKALRFKEELAELKPPKKAKGEKAIKDDKVLTVKEVQKLLHSRRVSKKMSLLMEFLFAHGCRISEVLNIQIKRIQKAGDRYLVPVVGKKRKERTLRVKANLIDRIQKVYQGTEFLFASPGGGPYRREYVSMKIKDYGRRLLGKNISAHTFRHTFATWKIKQLKRVKPVSEYLGHSSTSITLDMYVHDTLTDEELDSWE